jgi:type III secretion protein D
MKTLAELRILSGPAAGATMELGAGEYRLGSAEDNDIALIADKSLAAQHLRLAVRENPEAEGGAEVRVIPLARATSGGEQWPQAGANLLAGELLALGLTALAWRPPEAAWPPITLIPLEFAQRLLGERQEAVPSGKAVDPPPDVAPAPEQADDAFSAGPEESAGAERGKNRDIRKMALAGIALAVLVFLALGSLSPRSFHRSGDPATIERVRAAIGEAGFSGIEVRADPADRGLLTLSGEVADDPARQSLARVARESGPEGLRFKLDLSVRGDFLRAVEETLNAHGFYPAVRASSASADTPRIALSLYLKDELTEGAMLALAGDLPALDKAERRVVYARDLAPLLEAELSALGLDARRVGYLAGKVLLPYRLPPKTAEKLAASLDRVRAALGVPIVFQHTETAAATLKDDDAPKAILAKTLAPSAVENSRNADPLGGLKVVSVTPGAMPFVTLSDRQTLFAGAELPGGAVLTGIFIDRLEFLRGRDTYTHILQE